MKLFSSKVRCWWKWDIPQAEVKRCTSIKVSIINICPAVSSAAELRYLLWYPPRTNAPMSARNVKKFNVHLRLFLLKKLYWNVFISHAADFYDHSQMCRPWCWGSNPACPRLMWIKESQCNSLDGRKYCHSSFLNLKAYQAAIILHLMF